MTVTIEELTEEVATDPVKRVRVASPFQVCHEGTVYGPAAVAVVPEALADEWILNRWATDDVAD